MKHMTNETIEIITSEGKYPAPFTHRVLILCHEKNIPYKLTLVNTYEKPKWFLDLAPLGQVPVMRIANTVITDSRAIWEYLDTEFKPHLLPKNSLQCAQHRAWIGFADELAQEIAQFVKQGKILTHDLTRLNSLFNILNTHLKSPYFFGDSLSMIDITLISHVLWVDALEQRILPHPIICKYPKVSTWLTTMKNRSSLRETMGEHYAEHFIELLQRHDLIGGLEKL